MSCKFIEVDPDVLHVSFTDRMQTTKVVSFSIRNLIASSVCFKMKSTCTDRLLASPSCGYIRGLDQVEIIATITADFKNVAKDKFLIQAVEVKHEHNWTDISASEAMKRVPKGAVTTEIKIPVTIVRDLDCEKENYNEELTQNYPIATTAIPNTLVKNQEQCPKTSDFENDSKSIVDIQDSSKGSNVQMLLSDQLRHEDNYATEIVQFNFASEHESSRLAPDKQMESNTAAEKPSFIEEGVSPVEIDIDCKPVESKHLSHRVENYGDNDVKDTPILVNCNVENFENEAKVLSKSNTLVDGDKTDIEIKDDHCNSMTTTENVKEKIREETLKRETLSYGDIVDLDNDCTYEFMEREKLVEKSPIRMEHAHNVNLQAEKAVVRLEKTYCESTLSNAEILNYLKRIENCVDHIPKVFELTISTNFDRLRYIERNVMESLSEIKAISKIIDRNYRDWSISAKDTIARVKNVETNIQLLPTLLNEKEVSLCKKLKVLEENINENAEIKDISKYVKENSKTFDHFIQDIEKKSLTSDDAINKLVYKNSYKIDEMSNKLEILESNFSDVNGWVGKKSNETNDIMNTVNVQLIETINAMKSIHESYIECLTRDNKDSIHNSVMYEIGNMKLSTAVRYGIVPILSISAILYIWRKLNQE